MDISQFSQDILETQIPFFRPNGSPTKGRLLNEWRCTESSILDFKAWSDISNGSHQLPSFGMAEKVPDIIETGHFKIPVPELQTIEGIENLTSAAIQCFYQVKDSADTYATKELLHILTIFEYSAISGQLQEDVLCQLDLSLMRVLMKIGSLALSEFALKRSAIMNPCLHICLCSWKVAFTVYSTDFPSIETRKRRSELLNDLLVATAVRLVKIYNNYNSIAPCCCMQSFIFLLFGDKEKKFEEIFMKCFQELRQKGQIENKTLKLRDLPSTLSFFSYFVDLTEYLIQVKRLEKNSEWMARFLLRIFGMADQLISTDLLHVSEILVKFLTKNDPGSLARLKMISKKFWTEIERYLSSKSIKELEIAAVETPGFWSNAIVSSFSDCTSRETYLIRLLTILLTDRSIWESTRTQIKNHFTSKKISFNPSATATMLSIILSLCTNENTARELLETENLPQWLGEALESGSPTVQTIIFNSNKALAAICKRTGLEYSQEDMLAKLINRLPLPASSSTFLDIIMTLSPYQKMAELNLERAEMLSETEFCQFVSHFVDAGWTLPQKIWLRANQIVESGKGSNSIKNFLANQFRAGLQENKPFFTARLNSLLDKYVKDPWRIEVLHFCNKILEPGGSFNVNLDQFIPLWISSVIGFSDSHEVEVIDLTRSIWDGICQMFQKSGVFQGKVESQIQGWDQPLIYVAQTFQRLQEASSSNRGWALQKLSLWFPPPLTQSLQILIRKKDTDETTISRRKRAIEVISALLKSCADLLYIISEMNESKQPFNASTLVIALCAVTDREILQRKEDILSTNLTGIVKGLSSIPDTSKRAIFIKSRLKDIIISYLNTPIAVTMANILIEKRVYFEQLRKENPQLERLCDQ